MKAYTGAGDKGETRLFGGEKVAKDSLRVEAYGTVDELNSVLSVTRSHNKNADIEKIFKKVQNELFELGADLATPLSVSTKKKVPRITASHVKALEEIIDEANRGLTPLTHFIMPGGGLVSSHLHFARSVCRRAERKAVALSKKETINPQTIAYLNRLSSLLFVLARRSNLIEGYAEEIWKG